MRTRSFLIVATLVVLLVVAAGGIYADDKSRENQIAKGITVGGVDVGGMKEAAARAKLRAAVLEPLNRPVVYGDRIWADADGTGVFEAFMRISIAVWPS